MRHQWQKVAGRASHPSGNVPRPMSVRSGGRAIPPGGPHALALLGDSAAGQQANPRFAIRAQVKTTNGRMSRKRQEVLYPLGGKVLCKQLRRGRWHKRMVSESGIRKWLLVVKTIIVPHAGAVKSVDGCK